MKQFAEFSLGFMGVYIIAHVVYMLVPGYGPFRFLAESYTHPIPVGFWYQRVLEAVNGAGAQKDIFPSLHTAGPTFCFLFALRHRRKAPFKYVWPITGFFATNIVIATMFLRWHYLIDIVAGLSIATGVSIAAHHISRWEHEYRRRRGLQPLWTALLRELPEPDSSAEQGSTPVSNDAAHAR
jgi:membrane-associated phospholipid phosphatase